MDAEEGIALINEILKDEEAEAYQASVQVWATLAASGATDKSAPAPPGSEDDSGWMTASELASSENRDYKLKEVNSDIDLGLDLEDLLYKKD